MATGAILVYVTTSSCEEAEKIARAVVGERLAACANILGRIRAIYHWRGRVEYGDEWALLLKTQNARWKALEKRIRSLHSYEVPCIVAMPAVKGCSAFLRWIRTETAEHRQITARKRKP